MLENFVDGEDAHRGRGARVDVVVELAREGKGGIAGRRAGRVRARHWSQRRQGERAEMGKGGSSESGRKGRESLNSQGKAR